MIVGIITAIALLFGSGSFEVFFLPNFEKGVKEYVIGKERPPIPIKIMLKTAQLGA